MLLGPPMPADRQHVTIELGWAWWVKPYVYTLILFAWLHGMQPDEEKAVRMILRGAKIKVTKSRQV